TLFGTEVKGAYEYTGRTYLGRRVHVEAFDTCAECHGAHTQEVQVAACGGCHPGVAAFGDLVGIRVTQADFDGDGNVAEGIAGEIDTMREALITAMQAYTGTVAGALPIIYNPTAYPYFFGDADASGAIEEGEEGYNTWTPRLLRAAYNLQYAGKDPGGFAHNPLYIIQVLYDSLQDVGYDVSGMTRP
ncbi:MAG: Cytochrome c family protein, partial [Actinobacteria bacterium]|nr:Cytochrome c family protein [Actinomycetota bacterium]